MTRTEARKAMKQVEDVLGPARNTRSQLRKLRTRTEYFLLAENCKYLVFFSYD